MLIAKASSAQGDRTGTIGAYRTLIAVATAARIPEPLAVAYNLLGNALREIGEFDEALRCFGCALSYESTERGRAMININKALTLTELGDLVCAEEIYRGVLDHLPDGFDDKNRGILLDNLASSLHLLNRPADALRYYVEAGSLIPADEPGHRAINLVNQARVHQSLGGHAAEEEAFLAAYGLAMAQARRGRDIEHYRTGFAESMRNAIEPADPVNQLFLAATYQRDNQQWMAAMQLFEEAAAGARKQGDEAFALRCEANQVGVLGDAGQADLAAALATQVRRAAARQGLALPEL